MSEWKPTSMHDALGNKKPSGKQINFWKIFAVVALVVVCLLGVLNSCRNRYRSIADDYLILDTWTGNVYEIETKVIIQPTTE